jgi:hypothetical protein
MDAPAIKGHVLVVRGKVKLGIVKANDQTGIEC